MLRPILVNVGALVLAIALAFILPFELRPEQIDAFWTVTPVLFGLIALCFVAGELSGNVSQVDKLWSNVPILYAWLYAWQSGFDPRVSLMAALITVWGARLTYNFGRRGGYSWPPWSGEEDYRWEQMRNKPLFKGHRWRFSLFNLVFICLYQMTLIYCFTLPVLVAWTGEPLGVLDAILAVAVLSLVAIEWTADQQQFDYQEEKHRQIRELGAATGVHAVGFTHTGLWRWSRHPNYAAEQSVWVCIYAFSVVATGQLYNPTAIGVVLLLLLFLGSSDFSEGLSRAKYPAYAEYSKRTPRFWPVFWGERFKPSTETDEQTEKSGKPLPG